MATNGLHVPLVQMGMGIGAGPKVAIQPTPGAIRKQPQMKPKQRKSRTGCMTCKAKRLKCDEKKVLRITRLSLIIFSPIVINVPGKESSVRGTLRISSGRVSRICRNRKRMRPSEERALVPL